MIPISLSRYFADSHLFIHSYAAQGSVLTIRIEKEIGPETGIIQFHHVSYVHLPVALPGETIHAHPIRGMEPSFWSRSQLDEREFESDDVVFEIESQDGPSYFVVAKSIGYEIAT